VAVVRLLNELRRSVEELTVTEAKSLRSGHADIAKRDWQRQKARLMRTKG
jgi:hypothetical protein